MQNTAVRIIDKSVKEVKDTNAYFSSSLNVGELHDYEAVGFFSLQFTNNIALSVFPAKGGGTRDYETRFRDNLVVERRSSTWTRF